MAVAVAPVQMARTDFGVHDEHAPRVAGANVIGGGLDAEGRRRAGDIHVETETVDAERVLNLDRHRGIRPLHFRRRAQHRTAVAPNPPGAPEPPPTPRDDTGRGAERQGGGQYVELAGGDEPK